MFDSGRPWLTLLIACEMLTDISEDFDKVLASPFTDTKFWND